MTNIISYGAGIYAIDADYVRPKLAAIHLIVENGRAAFIDTGCNSSIPNVLAALEQLEISLECIDYVVLTHIHLDHAGGASAMMRSFPNAQLVVHPRGGRHMVDPSRLMEGTIAVYGKEATFDLYGDILPIDAKRIVEAKHETKVHLAGRELLFLDTPGHAKHHIAIVDGKTGHIFTGDNFGLSYSELDTDGRQFVFPTTTPVQFEPAAMHATIDMLMGYQPQAMYLTHFGQLRDVPAKANDLHRMLDGFVSIGNRHRHAGDGRHALIRADLVQLLLDEVSLFGCLLPESELLTIFDNDFELNAQGIICWLDSEQASA
jgi:glyoxylase-like metal-dependent hydrolase (beta-lactamase superfamily II)